MMRRCSLFLLAGLFLAGCSQHSPPQESTSQRPVKIEWLGHTSFLITSSLGTSVLTNPFTPGSTNFTPPRSVRPDVLLVSRERKDFNDINIPANAPRIFRGSVAVGGNNAAGITVRGQGITSDASLETIAGMNVVFTWMMDGIRFCFLGAPPRALTAEELNQLKPVDVLFVPVGVRDSLNDYQAAQIVQALHPRVIVPMGPSTSRLTSWAQTFQDSHILTTNSFILSAASLPPRPAVVVCGNP